MASKQFVVNLDLVELSVDPAPPGMGFATVYSKTDGNTYVRTANGTIHNLTQQSGGQQNVYFQTGTVPAIPAGSNTNEYFLLYLINGDLVTPFIWEPEIV